MRIIIAGQTYHPAFNGQSIFTVNLAEGLASRGHEVHAIIPSTEGRLGYSERNGVHLHSIKSFRLDFLHPDVFLTPFPMREIQRLVKELQPDVIHLHDHYPISQAILRVARRKRIKVIGTNHFMPENLAPYFPGLNHFRMGLEWGLWQWVFGAYNHLDAVTAPSRTAANILRRKGLRVPVYPISCGVDLNRFHPFDADDDQVSAIRLRYNLDPGRKLFLFIGRVDEEKRLDVLLHALKQMNRDDIQLGIGGIGAAQAGLQTLVRQLELEEQVRFLGFVPSADLPGLLNSADVFAMPSQAELLSIATLEAMACARPVLAARALALPELVVDGLNGRLFRSGDPTDAACSMALLADHTQDWAKMGAASLERVQSHSLENTLQSYEMLYRGVSAGVGESAFSAFPQWVH